MKIKPVYRAFKPVFLSTLDTTSLFKPRFACDFQVWRFRNNDLGCVGFAIPANKRFGRLAIKVVKETQLKVVLLQTEGAWQPANTRDMPTRAHSLRSCASHDVQALRDPPKKIEACPASPAPAVPLVVGVFFDMVWRRG
jgi:hypothetical protein